MSASHDDSEKASRQEQAGLVSEFIDFLKRHKSFWLLPIAIVLLLLSALFILSSFTAVEPDAPPDTETLTCESVWGAGDSGATGESLS